MKVSSSIDISRSKEDVWAVITDIENSINRISSIIAIHILEKPEKGLIGLKWRETRQVFGKDATEVMWVTDCVENEYYETRAESHGSIYKSRLSLTEASGETRLTMAFSGKAQTLVARILTACMSVFIKGHLEKELAQDLSDIKKHLEKA